MRVSPEAFPHWGVPRQLQLVATRSSVRKLLDNRFRSGDDFALAAPAGFGKTALLADVVSGLRSNVIWLSIDRTVRGWDDLLVLLLDALSAQGLLPGGRPRRQDSVVLPSIMHTRRMIRLAFSSSDLDVTLVLDNAEIVLDAWSYRDFGEFAGSISGLRTVLVINRNLRPRDQFGGSAVTEAAFVVDDADLVELAGAAGGMDLERARAIRDACGGAIEYVNVFLTAADEAKDLDDSRLGQSLASLLLDRAARLTADGSARRALLVAALYPCLDVPSLADVAGVRVELFEDLVDFGLVKRGARPGGSGVDVAPIAVEALTHIAQASFEGALADLARSASAAALAKHNLADAVSFLQRAGLEDEAIETARDHWSECAYAAGPDAVATALDRLSPGRADTDLELLSARILVSLALPTSHDIAMLHRPRVLASPLRTIDAYSRVGQVVIHTARSWLAFLESDVEYARRYAELAHRAASSAEFLESPIAERFLATLDLATANAALAAGDLVEARRSYEAVRVRAGTYRLLWQLSAADAGASFVLAVAGERGRALELADDAVDAANQYGWQAAPFLLLAHYARILVLGATDDREGLAAVSLAYQDDFDDRSPWAQLSTLIGAVLDMFAGRFAEAYAEASRLASASDSVLPMIAWINRYLLSDLQLAMGRTADALSTAELLSTLTPSHDWCPTALRARCLVSLGEPMQALEITEPCLELGAGHATRSLCDVQFARAFSFWLLDRRERAVDAFIDALRLCVGNGSLGALRMLPETLTHELQEAALLRDPELVRRVLPRRVNGLASRAAERLLRLTPRERKVVNLLVTPLTLRQIAQELFVSQNTIKTQSRSIFKKLEVTSRGQLAALVNSMGVVPSSTSGGPRSAGQGVEEAALG